MCDVRETMSIPIYLFSISSHPDAISINSLSVNFLKPEINFSNYDHLIITSKQTSEALKQYDSSEYLEKEALCISKQSALSYKALGGKVLDIGGGYGDNLESKIRAFPKEIKWLYLRAKVVASDFVKKCQDDGYDIQEAIVYSSDCSQAILDVELEDESILIFTSPSSLKCFLSTHTINPKSKVIVIGTTTAKAVPETIEYHISKETTIDSCMELAQKL